VSLRIEERIAKLVVESDSCFRTYPLPRFRAIVLRPHVRSPYESNFPQAPAHGRGPVEGQLVFVIIAPSTVSTTEGVELTSLASMARVTHSVSSLMGMFEWNLGPSFEMGSAKSSCGIPLLLNLPSSRRPSIGILWARLEVRIKQEG